VLIRTFPWPTVLLCRALSRHLFVVFPGSQAVRNPSRCLDLDSVSGQVGLGQIRLGQIGSDSGDEESTPHWLFLLVAAIRRSIALLAASRSTGSYPLTLTGPWNSNPPETLPRADRCIRCPFSCLYSAHPTPQTSDQTNPLLSGDTIVGYEQGRR